MLQFSAEGTSCPPRDAGTIVVLREASVGALEVFCVRRHGQSAFLGGAVVFPGGKLDQADGDPRWRAGRTTAVDARSIHMVTRFADPGATAASVSERDTRDQRALALAVCACRETLEEATIVPTLPGVDHGGADELRRAASEGLCAALEGADLVLDTGRLVPFGRWVTPGREARRYDARFFLMALPPGQVGTHDARETTDGFWASPHRVLEGFRAGALWLAPPTLRTIELLATTRSIAAARELALQQSLEPVCPEFVAADPPMLVLPGDPLHSLRTRRVAGPSRFVLRDARFLSEEPA